MADSFVLKIADTRILVKHLYSYVREYCDGFITDEAPELCIEITEEDIEYERERSDITAKKEGRRIHSYSADYLESLAVYRKITELLTEKNIILFHCSAVSVDGMGYLFTAKSGTGKSTHTRLWREYFGERAVMINDDKPLIRLEKNGAVVYGTPWNGKHRLGANMSVPVKALCILERDTENHISAENGKKAFDLLLQQTNRPRQPQLLIKTIGLVKQLSESVPVYRLGCNMDIEAAKTAYDGMAEK